jgi:hypothetical protein
MIRSNWKTVSTLVTMVVIAGCYDGMPTTPAASSKGTAVSAALAPQERPNLSLGGDQSDNTSADFVVPVTGGVFFIGNNAVIFPARSICNPATSSYGLGTWESDCDPATAPIAVHAVVHTESSAKWIDFTPALRFVPSSSPSRWVWLYMYNPAVSTATDLSRFTIKYSATFGDPGIDESLTDPTLRTYVDRSGAITLRRIKHFSGYQTSTARECDPATESDCTPNP